MALPNTNLARAVHEFTITHDQLYPSGDSLRATARAMLCRRTLKVQTLDDLRPFLPDMQVVFVDLGKISEETLLAMPELLARIRTLQLARSAELAFASLEAMIERGVKPGREEGRKEGRQEGLGNGVVIGRISTLQQILRQPVTAETELALLTDEALQAIVRRLEDQLGQPPVA